LRRGFNGVVATQDEELRRLIHRDYERVPVFFIGQYLQISPPPKSLRNKVQAELTEKYSAKNVIRPPEPADLIKDDNDED
jgi:hypothetical protein